MDKKTTDAIFIGICTSLLTITLVSMIGISIKSQSDREAFRQKNKEACLNLNAKFGTQLTAKEGFFKGVPMAAVQLHEQSIRVQLLKGQVIDEETFLCGDLELNENK